MKQILTFLFVLLTSIGMAFAGSTPTAEDLANLGVDVENNLVVCMKFPQPDCYNTVLYGSYNGWSENLDDMSWFFSLADFGFEGWYVAIVENPGENVEAKPIHLLADNYFNWKYQAGDKDAWVHVDGLEANVNNSWIEGEPSVVFPTKGLYIYELLYWKNHIDPCEVKPTYSYTVTLYPPYLCNDMVPSITGDFNNWDTPVQMTSGVDADSRTYYSATIEASQDDRISFCDENGFNWLKTRNGDDWNTFDPLTLGNTTTLRLDYSNTASYRFGDCIPPAPENVDVTVLVPSDCGMDISNGLYIVWWDGENHEEHVEAMTAGEGNVFTHRFSPGYYEYGYRFRNTLEDRYDSYYTQEMNQLTSTSLCWELGPVSWNYHELLSDADCSGTDHDYRPKNLQAVNTELDTVVLRWDAPSDAYQMVVRGYDAAGNELFRDYIYELPYRFALRNATPVEVASWEVELRVSHHERDYTYSAQGNAFTVLGDARIPHNLHIEPQGENVYTFSWESEGEVDHFAIQQNWSDTYTTTEKSYDVTVEVNQYCTLYVTAYDANNNQIGGRQQISFDTYEIDARDISVYIYIPTLHGFFGEDGCAILWHDATIGSEHVLPLSPIEENSQWYKATITDYKREQIGFSLINAATQEAATKKLSYSETIYEDRYFFLRYDSDTLRLDQDYAENLYPYDYAAREMSVTQDKNEVTFSWTVKDPQSRYYIRAYNQQGNRIWEEEVYGTELTTGSLSTSRPTELRWSVRPTDYSDQLETFSTFTLQPSPYVARDLAGHANEDGTFTFSWSPAEDDSVNLYQVFVRGAQEYRNYVIQETDETSLTIDADILFSGNYMMTVYSYSANEDETHRLGSVTDTIVLAPIAEHTLQMRVLMNPGSPYDMSSPLQFKIEYKRDSTKIVDATEEKHGWWSYALTTDQFGAVLRLAKESDGEVRTRRDTCVEYYENFRAVDCDSRANDYVPHHLTYEAQGDGTYALTWMMNRTERVNRYEIQVANADSSWYESWQVEALQATTPLLPYTGTYVYTITAYHDWDVLGKASDSFFIAPLEERTITLRVLEEYSEQGWIGVQVYRDWSGYSWLNIQDEFDENEQATGWCRAEITTDQPAVRIYLQSRWGKTTEFWMRGDTCLQINDEFIAADCNRLQPDYMPRNLHAESIGDGRVQFSWEVTDEPDAFYLQTLVNDSIPLTYGYLTKDTRTQIFRLNLDSVTEVSWYVLALKYRNEQYYNVGGENGNKVVVEPSTYAPKNLQLTANRDGSYTLTWDPVEADTVSFYEVQLRTPTSGRTAYDTQETQFTTPVLTDLGTYQLYVYSVTRDWKSLGWQCVTFQVAESETAQDITLRVLLHPDTGKDTPGNLTVVDMDQEIEPEADGDYWFRYTFSTTRPVQQLTLSGYSLYVAHDTCSEMTPNNWLLTSCDAVPHDYRIDYNTFRTVSEPGKVRFSWGANEVSDEYNIWAYATLNEDSYKIFDLTVTDTCYTYLVPDEMDGATLTYWAVRPTAPHYLGYKYRPVEVPLQKNQILLSNLQVTTTDSITYHFAWEANTDTVQYEIRVLLGNSENRPVCDAQVTSPHFEYTFASSMYGGWQVRAVNAQGTPLTAWINATDRIETKDNLKAISNLQGEVQNKTILFTWDSPLPAVKVSLSYNPTGNYSYLTVVQDSLVLGHSFTYETLQDGDYYLTIRPCVEWKSGEYQALDENAYTSVKVFTTKTYSVQVSTTTGGRLYEEVSGNYPEGYVLYITLITEDHYRFTGWSDGERETYRTLVVSSDTTIMAYFERRNEYTVTLNASEGGKLGYYGSSDWVETTHYQAIHDGDTWFGIETLPDEGYGLLTWSDGVKDTYRSIHITSDTTITAIFAPYQYATILAGEGGRVVVSGDEYDKTTNRYKCLAGSELTIKADPDEDYRFKAWSDGDMNRNRTLVIASDTTITALFEKASEPLTQYEVRVLSSNVDLGTVNAVSGLYYEGDQLTIIATPAYNASFVGWSDGVNEATRVITITSDTTLTAQFAIESFLITFLNADGTVIESKYWEYGATPECSVIPSMTPTEEYEFAFIGWTPEITPATADAIYTAVYEQRPIIPQGVEEINNELYKDTHKVMINGQFFILKNSHVYTITGQKVN